MRMWFIIQRLILHLANCNKTEYCGLIIYWILICEVIALKHIMGANSIDITQYRSRIGTFTGKNFSGNTNKASLGNVVKASTRMETFMILAYLLVLSNVTQKLLIISGVQLNPGPFQLGNKCFIKWIFLPRVGKL